MTSSSPNTSQRLSFQIPSMSHWGLSLQRMNLGGHFTSRQMSRSISVDFRDTHGLVRPRLADPPRPFYVCFDLSLCPRRTACHFLQHPGGEEGALSGTGNRVGPGSITPTLLLCAIWGGWRASGLVGLVPSWKEGTVTSALGTRGCSGWAGPVAFPPGIRVLQRSRTNRGTRAITHVPLHTWPVSLL